MATAHRSEMLYKILGSTLPSLQHCLLLQSLGNRSILLSEWSGDVTHALFVTLNLSTLVLVDGLKIKQENRHGKVNHEPVLTTLIRDHAPQFRQDRFPQIFHLSHQQKVQLKIQKRRYGDALIVRTLRVLLLPYPQSLLAIYVEALGSKSGEYRKSKGTFNGPTLDERI